MLKSKEERLREQQELEQRERLEKERERQEKIRQQQEEQKNREMHFCAMLDQQCDQDIICVQTRDVELKQAALRYLLPKGYVCVQNDFAFSKYGIHDYVLTFAKGEAVNKFVYTK